MKGQSKKGLLFLSALFLALAISVPLFVHAQGGQHTNPFRQLHYRFLGPIGNRADAAVGVPGNPMVSYLGAASGGIWKTEDGGLTWKPVFDHENVASIGALAIAPSEHNTVWAGTGEPFQIRAFVTMGNGVYKSTDAGRTWRHMGLDKTGHIARIIVNPYHANIVYVCAPGQLYKPGHEQGIFKTTDGGKTWKQILFVNQNTGCSELSMDPQDPNTLFAGMWQVQIRPWNLDSGGPSSGVYVTHDGGATWTKLTGHGLPQAGQAIGKVAVQVAPSNPNRVYALMEEDTPRFYRSDNGGKTWTLVNQLHLLDERAPYYTRFAVAPNDENEIFFVSVDFSYSLDGGKTIQAHYPGIHDNHDVWFDPLNAKRVMIADDEGSFMSFNGGKTWKEIVLPISQMYDIRVDNDIPYHVMGNRQDGPSFWGPSNNLSYGGRTGGEITAGDWVNVGGCESGISTPEPENSNIIWSGCFDGQVTRLNLKTGQSRMVSPWPVGGYGWAPKDTKYRWEWFPPLAISPFKPYAVYVGANVVFKTTNGGDSWSVISPDLTTNDKSHQQNSGGVALDNPPGTYDGSVLYAISVSPVKPGIVWTGSSDGQVNVTQDDGAHWTNVTKNIPNLPPWGIVTGIHPSPFEAGTAYLTVSFQQTGDYNPYVYKTSDFGKTWTSISSNIPHTMNSVARVCREDPVRRGMLWLGTDDGVYVSWDDGGHWTHLRNNMPPAPVFGLVIQPRYSDLVLGTYGRGIWILDDITPLREWGKAQQSDFYLFKPRPAYRYPKIYDPRAADANSLVIGKDPPYGADINFYLSAPAKDVTISITGAKGEPVRTLHVNGKAGINRVWWDLRYDRATPLHLVNSPPGQPWVKVGARIPVYSPTKGCLSACGGGQSIKDLGPGATRPYSSYGTFRGNALVTPGTYTVTVTADGKKLSAPIQVLRDPHSVGTIQDMAAETQFLLQVRSELSQIADMVNNLEWTRKRTQALEAMLRAKHDATLLKATEAFTAKTIAVENNFMDVKLTGRREDSFRNPMRLYGRLAYLGEQVNNSNWGGNGSELPPTQSVLAVNKLFQQRLAKFTQVYQQFMSTTGPQFEKLLRANHINIVVTR